MPINKKMKKKNQIPKYHAPSSKKMIRKIQDQLIKNFLTQWYTEEENRKILSMFGEKLFNLIGYEERKPNNWLNKKFLNPNKRWG